MLRQMNCIFPVIRCSDFELFEQLQLHRDLLVGIFFERVKILCQKLMKKRISG